MVPEIDKLVSLRGALSVVYVLVPFIWGLNEVTKGQVSHSNNERESVSKYVRMLLFQPLSTKREKSPNPDICLHPSCNYSIVFSHCEGHARMSH